MERFKLSSGREVSAYMGMIGINADGEVGHGSDGQIEGLASYDQDDADVQWTPIERAELAQIMIRRWQKFADPLTPRDVE